jgi:hypothetical protein
VCLYVYPPIVGGQGLGKKVSAAKNAHAKIEELFERRFLCGRYRIKESLWVCLCIPLLLLGNGSVNTFPQQRGIVGGVVFYSVRVVSNESLWVCLCFPLLLLGNGSVNTFPQQRGIVGGVVFYAVLVVSKESRRVVLPKTFCISSNMRKVG